MQIELLLSFLSTRISQRVALLCTAVLMLMFVGAQATYAAAPPLALKSRVAYVIDQDSGKVLLRKNASVVLPIASLTKLMTAIVIVDAKLSMKRRIRISRADVDRLKNSGSRLRIGTVITRQQALHLSLMSSENRAAHALARTYPGGKKAFVRAMNARARLLDMKQTRFVDPTGLSSRNRSSAHDLAILADAAYERPLLRKYSTSKGYSLRTGRGNLRYINSNRLVRQGDWRIGLQKTGYISEAGRCLLMQVKMSGRKLILVFLDSASAISRMQDAERVRKWVKVNPGVLRISSKAAPRKAN
jgi:D-alanyl-D-alanine endopeptidase (penicillin-binding protein 7)